MKERARKLYRGIKQMQTGQKVMSLFLAALMVLGLVWTGGTYGSPAQAELCENHLSHNEDCGYAEAWEAQACQHVHTEACEQQRLVCEETEEAHEHAETCYVTEQHCTHAHDAVCGYQEAQAGSACTHLCELCDPVGTLGTDRFSFDQNPESVQYADVEVAFSLHSDSLRAVYRLQKDEDGKALTDEKGEMVLEYLKPYAYGVGEYTLLEDGQGIALRTEYLNKQTVGEQSFRLDFASGEQRWFYVDITESAEPEEKIVYDASLLLSDDLDLIARVGGPLMLAASGVDQGLVVTFEAVSSSGNFVGRDGTMKLMATLSGTDNTDHAVVRIQIPNDVPGISFPDFDDAGNMIIYQNGTTKTLSLGPTVSNPSYIEFSMDVGETIAARIKVRVPNGYSSNPTTANFEAISVYEAGSKITGGRSLTGGTISFSAAFEWNKVTVTASPQNTAVAMVSGVARLSDDAKFTILGTNKYAGATYNLIFAKSYTLSGTITLPTGLSFPTGEVALANGGKDITVGGVVVASFSLPVTNPQITGQVLSFSYSATNATLDANGNQASGQTAADMANLNLVATLKAAALTVNTESVGGGQIVCAATFQVVPCKQTATTHNSNANDKVTITVPGASFTFTKSNNPTSATTIQNAETQPITYTIKVKNTSISTATNVVVEDTLPAELEFQSATPAGYTQEGQKISWNIGNMAAGEERTFTITVKVKAGTTSNTRIYNNAVLRYGSDSVQNSNSVSNLYDTSDAVNLLKTHGLSSPYTVIKGSVVPYTIKITNSSSVSATSAIVVTDVMQDGLVLTSAQLSALQSAYPGTTYNAATRTITFPSFTLSANSSKTFSYEATIRMEDCPFNDNDAVVNTAYITAMGLKSSATVHYRIKKADVSVEKTAGDPVRVSDSLYEVDFKVTLKNLGDKTEDLEEPLYFVDTMTGGLRPKGAGDATSGTLPGIVGAESVVGTWVRSGSSAPYTYTITWQGTIPVMESGETLVLTYIGEIEVSPDASGDFPVVNGTNHVVVKGSVNSHPGGSTGVTVRPPAGITKKITKQNESTGEWDNTALFVGDVVTYTLTVKNTTNKELTGTLKDILPSIKTGASFAWILGTNVSISAPAGFPTATLVSGTLTWANVTLPAEGEISVQVTLIYPLGETFYAAFGQPGEAVINKVTFAYADGTLQDSATHKIEELEITFEKTVDKATVDSAADNAADKTVTFTLQGFGTDHKLEIYSLMDTLHDIRNKFDITAVNYGNFTIRNLSGSLVGYTLEITFEDTTVQTFPVAAGTTANPSFTGGKTVADIVAIKWNFDAVTSLVINTPPTISATAKASANGTVNNRLYLAYDKKYQMVECAVSVRDSARLTKTLYDANGEMVTTHDGLNPAHPNEDYVYEIRFVNTYGRTIQNADLTITDIINLNPLNRNRSLTFTITHITASGTRTVTTHTVSASTWSSGNTTTWGAYSIVIPNNRLPVALAPNDILEIRFTVRTTDDFREATKWSQSGQVDYRLKNTVLVEIASEGETLEDISGPFEPERVLYVGARASLVGTAIKPYGTTGASELAFWRPQWEGQNFGNDNYALNGLPIGDANVTWMNINDEYTRVLIYDFTMSLGRQSIGDISISSIFSANLFKVYYNSNRLQFLGQLTVDTGIDTPDASEGGAYMLRDSQLAAYRGSTIETDFYKPITFITDDQGNTYGYHYGGALEVSATQVGSLGTVNIAKRWAAEFHMSPGMTITFRLVFAEKLSPHSPAPYNITNMDDTVVVEAVFMPDYLHINSNGMGTVTGLTTTATKARLDNFYPTNLGTYQNLPQPLTQSIPANVGDLKAGAASVMGGYTATNYVSSVVTVERPVYDVGIKSEATGFISAIDGSYHPIGGGEQAPGPEDIIEWKVTLTNYDTKNLTNVGLVHRYPTPYEGMSSGYGPGLSAIPGMTETTKWPNSVFSKNASKRFNHYDASSLGSPIPPPSMDDIVLATGDLSMWTPLSKATTNMIANTWEVALVKQITAHNMQGSYTLQRLNTHGWDQKTGTTGYGLLPGESLQVTLYMRPYPDSIITPDYRSYNLQSYAYLFDGRVRDNVEGELITEVNGVSNRYGVMSDAAVTIGGNFATTSQKSVSDGTNSVTGKDATNWLDVGTASDFRYTMQVESKGNISYSDLVLIDRLPMVGDGGAVNVSSSRNSAFPVQFASNPNVSVEMQLEGGEWEPLGASAYTVEFKQVTPTYSFSETEWDGSSSDGWHSAINAAADTALRVKLNIAVPAKAKLRVSFDAQVKDGEEPAGGAIAWNSFGYRYKAYDDDITNDRTLIAEPAKVGVRIGGARIEVNKKVNTLGQPLSGAVFSIYKDAACTQLLTTMTTNAAGIATSASLSAGTYYVKETTAPSGGYILSNQVHTVVITAEDVNTTIRLTGGDIINSRSAITMDFTKAIAAGSAVPTSDIYIDITGVFFGMGDAAVTRSLTFTPAECNGLVVKTLDNIIAGNTYTITERGGGRSYTFTATGEYTDGTSFAVTGGRFAPSRTGQVDIVNEEPTPGALRIRKTMGGTDGGETFTIEVTGVFDTAGSAVKTKSIEITSAQRDQWITVPGVLLGEVYTIRESYGSDNYTVSYTVEVVTITAAGADITVTNTPKAPGTVTIQKKVDGATLPSGSDAVFTVRITGRFAGTSATQQDITLQAPDFTGTVQNLIIGETYSVAEINIPAGYGTPVYTGLSNLNTFKVTDESIQIVVNNVTKTEASFRLTKYIEANELNVSRSFTFTLTGPSTNPQTYTGTVTTAGSGVVNWTGHGTSLELEPGSYTLTETLLTGSSADYQFKNYSVEVNGTATVTNSSDNPLTLHIGAGTSVQVFARNEVREGSLDVEKRIYDESGELQTTSAGETLYIGLFKEGESTPFKVEQLVWNSGAKKYDNAHFTNVPYGLYIVSELVERDGSYVKAGASSSGFAYSVTADQSIVLNAANDATGSPLCVVENRMRYAEADLILQKEFNISADSEILAEKVFTLRLLRADGEKINATEMYIDTELTASNSWTQTLTDLHLRAGEYLLYELPEENGGWSQLDISGSMGGAAMGTEILSDPAGVKAVRFVVTDNDLGSSMEGTVTAKNKAISKKLGSFVLLKEADDISGLEATERSFTFRLGKRIDAENILPIATGTLVKSAAETEAVVNWVDTEGNAFDPEAYLWEIGATYVLTEDGNNFFTLTDIQGATKITENGAVLGCEISITEETNEVSLLFANHRNVVNDMTIQKSILQQDESEEYTISATTWPEGASFGFAIYEKDADDDFIQIGYVVVDSLQPTVIMTTEALILGKTYYIRELSISPASRYAFQSFTGLSEERMDPTDANSPLVYAFTAETKLQIEAVNHELPITDIYQLKITKNLVDDAGQALAADGNQEFRFLVQGNDRSFYAYVTVPAGQSAASILVGRLTEGDYTVTELDTNDHYSLVSSRSVTQTVDDMDTIPNYGFTNAQTSDHIRDTEKVTNHLPTIGDPGGSTTTEQPDNTPTPEPTATPTPEPTATPTPEPTATPTPEPTATPTPEPTEPTPTPNDTVELRIGVTGETVVKPMDPPQKLDVILIMDASGSMYGSSHNDLITIRRFENTRNAAKTFAEKLFGSVNLDPQLSVVVFGGNGNFYASPYRYGKTATDTDSEGSDAGNWFGSGYAGFMEGRDNPAPATGTPNTYAGQQAYTLGTATSAADAKGILDRYNRSYRQMAATDGIATNAGSGTNYQAAINEAITRYNAIKRTDALPVFVFFTDGLPTNWNNTNDMMEHYWNNQDWGQTLPNLQTAINGLSATQKSYLPEDTVVKAGTLPTSLESSRKLLPQLVQFATDPNGSGAKYLSLSFYSQSFVNTILSSFQSLDTVAKNGGGAFYTVQISGDDADAGKVLRARPADNARYIEKEYSYATFPNFTGSKPTLAGGTQSVNVTGMFASNTGSLTVKMVDERDLISLFLGWNGNNTTSTYGNGLYSGSAEDVEKMFDDIFTRIQGNYDPGVTYTVTDAKVTGTLAADVCDNFTYAGIVKVEIDGDVYDSTALAGLPGATMAQKLEYLGITLVREPSGSPVFGTSNSLQFEVEGPVSEAGVFITIALDFGREAFDSASLLSTHGITAGVDWAAVLAAGTLQYTNSEDVLQTENYPSPKIQYPADASAPLQRENTVYRTPSGWGEIQLS